MRHTGTTYVWLVGVLVQGREACRPSKWHSGVLVHYHNDCVPFIAYETSFSKARCIINKVYQHDHTQLDDDDTLY